MWYQNKLENETLASHHLRLQLTPNFQLRSTKKICWFMKSLASDVWCLLRSMNFFQKLNMRKNLMFFANPICRVWDEDEECNRTEIRRFRFSFGINETKWKCSSHSSFPNRNRFRFIGFHRCASRDSVTNPQSWSDGKVGKEKECDTKAIQITSRNSPWTIIE